MMSVATQPRQPHPPLAHDARGHMLALPEGAAGWRVKRQTAGRPRVCVGPDRQPLRFPLDTSAADLLDMLGPGAYRLDAIDAGGEVLDYVTTANVGVEAPAESSAANDTNMLPSGPRTVGGGGVSDLRFALEVTAQMARFQSEALRSIADAQADWIKGLAAAKAIPRNGVMRAEAPPLVLPAATPTAAEEEAAEEEADEVDPSAEMTALGHVATIAQQLGTMVQAFFPGKTPAAVATPELRNAAPAAVGGGDPASVARVAEVLAGASPRARYYGCRLLAGGDESAQNFARALCTLPVNEATQRLEQLVAEPMARQAERRAGAAEATIPAAQPEPAAPAVSFAEHFEAVKSRLTPVEIMKAARIVASLKPEQLAQLQAHLMTMSPDDAAAEIRQGLIERGAAATAGARDGQG